MFKDFEWKRAVSILLLVAADAVPQLQPFKPLIVAVGGALGVVGITHGVVKQKKRAKREAKLIKIAQDATSALEAKLDA